MSNSRIHSLQHPVRPPLDPPGHLPRRLAAPALLLALVLVGSGCAVGLGAEPARTAVASAGQRPRHEGALSERAFPTVEAAVSDAFEAARRQAGPADRERLRLGTIRRVEGGFAWTAPVRSRDGVGSTAPMRVRLRLAPQDVAVFAIHPRSGHAELDRLNESVTRHERQLVDEQDPLHRPLYVLTPSRRVVRHPNAPEAVEVVSREAAARR